MIKLEEIVGYFPYGLLVKYNTGLTFEVVEVDIESQSFAVPENQTPKFVRAFDAGFKKCVPILRTELTDKEWKLYYDTLNSYDESDFIVKAKFAFDYFYSLKYDIHGLVKRSDAIAVESLTTNPYIK